MSALLCDLCVIVPPKIDAQELSPFFTPELFPGALQRAEDPVRAHATSHRMPAAVQGGLAPARFEVPLFLSACVRRLPGKVEVEALT